MSNKLFVVTDVRGSLRASVLSKIVAIYACEENGNGAKCQIFIEDGSSTLSLESFDNVKERFLVTLEEE